MHGNPSERRVRVLLVCGPAAGGMRRHLEALAVGLPGRGFEVRVAAPASVRLPAPVARYTLELGDRPRPASDLGAVRALRCAVREWQPDLVHAHGVKAAFLVLASLSRGRPSLVVTFHNLWRGGPLTLPLRFFARRAAAAVAVSEAVRAKLVRYRITPRQIVVIPNGVDLTRFHPAPSPPISRPWTAAFLGRLTEEKGVPTLLEMARSWPDEVEARFLVAGDGPLRAAVEAEARRPGSRLAYLGQQEEVLPIYHECDVVLMPSLAEGHPMTALEAMACGLPLIASRVGGLPEIVVDGETGLLVAPGDPSKLAAATTALAADRTRARTMGEAGRGRVEAEFTLERMLERLIAVYRDVLR